MNLTTDPWIPVVWDSGACDKVSIKDAFLRGREIRDLAVRPHERIALMRLLICVAQAALDGPKDHADWQTCADRLPKAAEDYLAQWQQAFELFGEGQRFLQVAGLVSGKAKDGNDGNSSSKMDLSLATGNATTLFDNAGGSERTFGDGNISLMLLTFQCFSPGGLIGDVLWREKVMGRSSNHAPCIIKSMAHAYILGGNLIESVVRNLLPGEDARRHGLKWGKPVWESMPDSSINSDNSCSTYLGRLVPLSRAIWLNEGSGMLLGNGLTYDGYPRWRESAATIVKRGKDGQEERQALSLSATKGIWREVPAITVMRHAGQEAVGGPLAMGNLDKGQPCDIWVGGLIADKAKLIDAVESVFHLPAAMLHDVGPILYQEGVMLAESTERKLGRAIASYRLELKDDLGGEHWKRGNKVKQKVAAHYWTAIEQRVGDLLAVVGEPGLLVPDGASSPAWGQTAWGRAIHAAARAAYELACPHETPRQMKAYAHGLKALFRRAAEDQEASAETEEDGE